MVKYVYHNQPFRPTDDSNTIYTGPIEGNYYQIIQESNNFFTWKFDENELMRLTGTGNLHVACNLYVPNLIGANGSFSNIDINGVTNIATLNTNNANISNLNVPGTITVINITECNLTGSNITANYISSLQQFYGSEINNASNPSYTWSNDKTTGFSHPTISNIGVNISGQEIARYNAIGLGIFTQNPQSGLHVATDALFDSNTSMSNLTILGNTSGNQASFSNIGIKVNALDNKKIVLFGSNNNDYQFSGFGIDSSNLRYNTDNRDHVFYTSVNSNSSSEIFRIGSDGRVDASSNLFYIANQQVVYGRNYLNASNLTSVTNTTTTYQDKLTYVGTIAEAGNYMILGLMDIATSTATRNSQTALVVNGIVQTESQQQLGVSAVLHNIVMTTIMPLSQSNHTFIIRYRRPVGSQTTTLTASNAKLYSWRIT